MNKHLLVLVIAVLLIFGVAVLFLAVELTGFFNEEEGISPEEAYDLIQNNKENENFTIIDVRTLEEYLGGHIENAINLNYYSESFRDDLNELDKNKTYLVYCRLGRRSAKALGLMEDLGFQKVYNMLGGITQWDAEGFPIVK